MIPSKVSLPALHEQRYLGFRRALATMTGSHESAHEIVEEAFARAVAEPQGLGSTAALSGAHVWELALSILFDESLNETRRSLDEMLGMGPIELARDPALSAAMRKLPLAERRIFFLRHYAELSYREIAAVCGTSETEVGASIGKARKLLVHALCEPL